MKSGFISIIGRPNVGKSTLLNKLAGEKVAVVSNKPQTTRNKIMAVVTTKEVQMVFLDTPGIHKPKTRLGEFMLKSAQESLDAVDAIVVVVDAVEDTFHSEEIIKNLEKFPCPVILVVNKVDLIEKQKLLPLFEAYSKLMNFEAIIPVVAKDGMGVDVLFSELLKLLGEGPMYFDEDTLTDQPERQLVAEMIREKALWMLDKEIPHGIAVEITKFHQREDKEIIDIFADICCEKKSHKGIIIGKNGAMLKKIGSLARPDIERHLNSKINLQLWVKIKEDWRNSDNLLKNFGFK